MNPYKALSSYDEKDSKVYWGRDIEVANVYQAVLRNRSTILIGPSGCGKSSLLKAGLFPKLRLENSIPIRIVFNEILSGFQDEEKVKMTSSKLWSRIMDFFIQEIKEQNIEVIPKHGWNQYTNANLWNYLHLNKFTDEMGFPVSFTIIFDQFEQVLSIFDNLKETCSFFDTFECLCGLRNTLQDSLFSSHAKDLSRDEISEILSNNTKFLVAIRQDYMFDLNVIAQNYPVLSQNHLLITRLNEEQARNIIIQSRDDNGSFLFTDDEAHRIIAYLTNDDNFEFDGVPEMEVDTMMLSLVLYELYEKYETTKSSMASIIKDDIKGDGSQIIEDFYNRSIGNINIDLMEYLEKNLVNELKRRETLDIEIIEKHFKTENIKNDLEKLEGKSVIRIFQQSAEEKRVEFVHDRLCDIIHKKNLERAEENERRQRNIEFNRKKRASERNVLIHKGRRLLDNAIDFGENRCLSDYKLHNPIDRLVDLIKFWTVAFDDYFYEDDIEFVNQQVFSDPQLRNSSCILNFCKDGEMIPTIDGLYGVELKYEGAKISDIFFKGKKVLSDGSVSLNSPIYILGGYCGIHIDYDDKSREIRRTYLDEDSNPIIIQDGYSIVETQYDNNGNPIKIRYRKLSEAGIISAEHNNGNYGYDSVFDKDGNEIERYFVDENNNHAMIVSGVYGKRMTYDKDTFRLTAISNVDSEGNLMPDKDGYVTVCKKYDEKGRPILDLYLDKDGRPWKNNNGVCGDIDIIDDTNNIITKHYIDENKNYISQNDRTFKTIMRFNEQRQLTEFYSQDINDNIIEEEDKSSIYSYEYDEQNRIKIFKILDKERIFVYGKRLGYNKEGTHIVSEFVLADDWGVGINDSLEVEGIEYEQNGDAELPILQKFINVNNQFKTCNSGYNAIRNWEDDQGRIVMQCYYDSFGSPMPNNDGVFGVKMEYIDSQTTKQTNIDAEGNAMVDINGVAYVVTTKEPARTIVTNYNIEGAPYEKDDWVHAITDIEVTNEGRKETISFCDSNMNVFSTTRPWQNKDWGGISCFYEERIYDNKDRITAQYFKDADGNLVEDSSGGSYAIWDYDDKNNREIVSIYNIDQELKLRMLTRRDRKGRTIEVSYLDKDDNYVELERRYSGETYEYDDERKMKTVTFIDSKGNICNNNDGFAQRIFWSDSIGRVITQKDVTVDGAIHGYIIFIDHIDSTDRVCSYHLHREDGQGNIVPNENGSFYDYYEDDSNGRTIKQLYLDTYKEPMSDCDGDYGLSYEYDDDKSLTIITCLDESGCPHNNRLGYGIIHIYINSSGKEGKRLYFTKEKEPFVIEKGCYGYSYEYPNEYNRVVGYLNDKGEITTNSNGYAYQEECYNQGKDHRKLFFYDSKRNNTYYFENENNTLSFGKDVSVCNNACGYTSREEFYENGELRFYKFLNINNEPVADNDGDYGKEVQKSEDGSTRRFISLDKNYNRHINDYGYCICDIITDIVGDKVLIWRDMEGNQVLPKTRTRKRIKNWFAKFRRMKNSKFAFNCRQIGAIYDCILLNVEGKGLAKKNALHDTYVLFEYNEWSFGDDFSELEKLLKSTKESSKRVVLLPIELNGSLLLNLNNPIEIKFPKGVLGMRFVDWSINKETLNLVFEKYVEWKEIQTRS